MLSYILTKGDKVGMKKGAGFKLVIAGVAIAYVGYLLINHQVNAYKLKQEIAERRVELDKLKDRNQRLQDEVKMSRTDPLYMERLARERLGLIKEGETPVIHSAAKKN